MKEGQSALKQLMEYNPETGKIVWLPRPANLFMTERAARTWNSRYPGCEAFTTISTTGYFYGNVFNSKHFTHRVAFVIMEGYYPEIVDHIDGNKLNNCWDNLRAANSNENARNVSSAKNSSSKYLGVSFIKARNKWFACITIDGKTKSLGRYASEEDAARAYDAAAIMYYGEFARLNFREDVGK